MQDDDVSKRSWIYEYLLTWKEKYLNIRAFDDKDKRKVYEEQKWICSKCTKHFELNEMDADHIKPWHEWWKTNIENCQMLCKNCNRTKSGK